MEATAETLAYYGALLIKSKDVIQFPDDDFPVFSMNVGEDYVRDFIMTEEGGGFYLEYHSDRPRFHMPIRGGRFLSSGKME